MKPNIEKYRPFVEMYDLSEEQKVELIHDIWRIVESFVDRALGIDPAAQALAAAAKDATRQPPMLEFEKIAQQSDTLTPTFQMKALKRGRRIK